MREPTPVTIHLKDYTPPPYLVDRVELDVDIRAEDALVTAKLAIRRNPASKEKDPALVLDGDELELISVSLDGSLMRGAEFELGSHQLVIPSVPAAFTLETVTRVLPHSNTKLEGLYAAKSGFVTQCEAEGFRRITWYVDRPDNLARFVTTLHGDKEKYPVLLSNGNLVGAGDEPGGRHWAKFDDPYPKPSYLFALVAARLEALEDSITTRSGKCAKLFVYVEPGRLDQAAWSMDCLKRAIAWDERRFGLELDLERYVIVAVGDFNSGAMENKGLNIFNSRYILADQDTATDADYDAVAGVVAHEYFHKWSGNRVTCRDWFQLSLKEGFTVFRDQQFSADQGSRAVKRIEDVRMLRAAQFPEDQGPLAHPIRPESYIEISNFYTATVYNKGAEVIRMLHTMLGPDRFRAGSDLYFERHDGEAATCEDFVKAMEDASGVDLARFRLWYAQAGTPKLGATIQPNGDGTTVRLTQSVPPTPGQPDKRPMPMPVSLALFGDGGAKLAERLVILDETEAEVVFEGVRADKPVLSINRGFSAPVIVDSDRSAAELAFLSAHDDDPFARYEAMQQLMLDTLVAAVKGAGADHRPVIEAVRRTLTNPELDPAFIAEAVLLPSEAFVGDNMEMVDPDAIHDARERLRAELGAQLEPLWRDAHVAHAANRFEYSPAAKGARRLKNVALGYIAAAGAADGAALAFRQFDGADNMTDRQGALGVLVNTDTPERSQALDAFYDRYRHNGLVLDKWFSTQVLSHRPDTLDVAEALTRHPDFTLSNPNRLRSVVGALSVNQRIFHWPSGAGYRFLADMILEVDKLNPQTAAKLVPPLGRWRRFDDERAARMKAELTRIVGTPGLSKDVFEQASKSLAA